MQGGTYGTENCDGRGLMCSGWPIRVGWVAGSGWMPIWLTNADQLRSAHAASLAVNQTNPKVPVSHAPVLCEMRVLDLVIETRMQQGILGFVKLNYCFGILSPWQEILTDPTVDNLLYLEIVKVEVLFANGNTAQSSAFRTYHCAVDRS